MIKDRRARYILGFGIIFMRDAAISRTRAYSSQRCYGVIFQGSFFIIAYLCWYISI